jgi:MFS family permease
MFLLLRARDMGLPEHQVPLLWALVAAVAAICSTPLSALSDRYGRKRLIVTGWLVYAMFYLCLGWIADTRLLWPLFAIYGLFMAATEGAEKALVADLASQESFGAAYGWYNLTAGIMLLPASLLFGALWQNGGPMTAFAIASGCAFVSAGLLVFWVNPTRHRAD